jgi:tetratricopeptide (TPR) repeat protein
VRHDRSLEPSESSLYSVAGSPVSETYHAAVSLMSRIEQIRQMLESDAQDVFLNFALAMEYVKENRVDEAVAQFERVCEIDSKYVPAYFQKANTLADAGRPDEAKEVLTRGIEIANEIGDHHAAAEMSDVLKLL